MITAVTSAEKSWAFSGRRAIGNGRALLVASVGRTRWIVARRRWRLRLTAGLRDAGTGWVVRDGVVDLRLVRAGERADDHLVLNLNDLYLAYLLRIANLFVGPRVTADLGAPHIEPITNSHSRFVNARDDQRRPIHLDHPSYDLILHQRLGLATRAGEVLLHIFSYLVDHVINGLLHHVPNLFVLHLRMLVQQAPENFRPGRCFRLRGHTDHFIAQFHHRRGRVYDPKVDRDPGSHTFSIPVSIAVILGQPQQVECRNAADDQRIHAEDAPDFSGRARINPAVNSQILLVQHFFQPTALDHLARPQCHQAVHQFFGDATRQVLLTAISAVGQPDIYGGEVEIQHGNLFLALRLRFKSEQHEYE